MGKKQKGKKQKGKGTTVARGTKSAEGGSARRRQHGGAARGGGTGRRQIARLEARQAARLAGGRQPLHKHGGEDAVAERRRRMRAKVLERQLGRQASSSEEERRGLLLELGHLRAAGRQLRAATDAFQQALAASPRDEDLAVRTPLLCALMDQARTEEASELARGPLFDGPGKEVAAPEASLATTVGQYTRALLAYISVQVLGEHRESPGTAAAAEARLCELLRTARGANPFAAEFLAFAPAFEPHFPPSGDLPAASECAPEELPMLEALQYCCHHRQAAVWLDTDEGVRRFLCRLLFEDEAEAEGEEAPPLATLPPPRAGEGAVLSRWRRARQDALELWAAELSSEGGREDCEEDEGASSGESSLGESSAVADAEDRLSFC